VFVVASNHVVLAFTDSPAFEPQTSHEPLEVNAAGGDEVDPNVCHDPVSLHTVQANYSQRVGNIILLSFRAKHARSACEVEE
jgi:hypothetical protein